MESSRVLGFITIAHRRRPSTKAAGCKAIQTTHLEQDSTTLEVGFMRLSGTPVESKFGSSRVIRSPKTLRGGIPSQKIGAYQRQISLGRVTLIHTSKIIG